MYCPQGHKVWRASPKDWWCSTCKRLYNRYQVSRNVVTDINKLTKVYKGEDAEFTEVKVAEVSPMHVVAPKGDWYAIDDDLMETVKGGSFDSEEETKQWIEKLRVAHQGQEHYNAEGRICQCTFFHPQTVAKTAGKLEWLRGRPDMQDAKGKALLGYFQHLPKKMDPLLPWLAREVKKGRLEHHVGDSAEQYERAANPQDQFTGTLFYPTDDDLGTGMNKVPVNYGEMAHMGDWFHDKRAPNRQGLDIMQHTYPEVQQKVIEYNKWLEEQEAEANKKGAETAPVAHDFGNGWTLRQLRPEDLKYEGDAMGHCIGSYGNEIGSGNTLAYSLRDPNHRPHATMELEPQQWQSPSTGKRYPTRYETEVHGPPPGTRDIVSIPHSARIVQIQGKGNKVPNPEYQEMLKQWFETFPEHERPYWEEEEELTHPKELREGTDRGAYGHGGLGGYGPHGDYGVDTRANINYDSMLENSLPGEHRRHGETVDRTDLEAIYKAALKRNEIPMLHQALEPFSDSQQNNFDKWRDMNYELTVPHPDETDPDQKYPLTLPNGDVVNNMAEHERAYYEDEDAWVNDHPGIMATNYMYKLLHPHYDQKTGFTNEFQTDPTASVKETYPEMQSGLMWNYWTHPGQEEWDQQRALVEDKDPSRIAASPTVMYHVGFTEDRPDANGLEVRNWGDWNQPGVYFWDTLPGAQRYLAAGKLPSAIYEVNVEGLNLQRDPALEGSWFTVENVEPERITRLDQVNPHTGATRVSEYGGYSNWHTWNTKLMMDSEHELYEESRQMAAKGYTPEQIRDWALQKIVGPHNQQAIEDSRKWNEIPQHERLDPHYEELKRKNPDAAKLVDSLGMGADVSDDEPTLIDPELVNWHEIHQDLNNSVNEDKEYEQENQRLQGIGLDFAMPGHSDHVNQMLDAWMKHHGVMNKDQKTPEGFSAEHRTMMNVPVEQLVNDGKTEEWWQQYFSDPTEWEQYKQQGYMPRGVREHGWDTLHDIMRGQAAPTQYQTMQTALQGQGYTPEQVAELTKQRYEFEPETNRWIDLYPKTIPNDPTLDQPGNLTLPPEW